ncbi:WRKY transcription factor SUSIBA2-like [Zingiber officinale]|uniref:WRKY transcription factor SUSIBA2-like n=1 Tax=Zingiber officinale TaxID=94328 RepID=UPI001C4BA480|nr:WRKY transcription factor SUSIBA2-like [Zingiber officinale]
MEGNPELVGVDLCCGEAKGGSPAAELLSEGSGAGNHDNDDRTREGRAGNMGKPDPGVSQFAGAIGARYKSMPPARLPIARSPCLTIPPGFSPSALLESPVFLTDMKAEPSPTTGTLNMPSIVGKTVTSGMSASTVGILNLSSGDEGNAGDSEFRSHAKVSYSPGLSSLRPLISSQPLGQASVLSKKELVSAPTSSVEGSKLSSFPIAKTDFSEVKLTKCSEQSAEMLQSDSNEPILEKSAEDGYNWRKYGQKHVKGSEYPRSYYKCTHPNCQMKKQIERSHDGQITEVIYKGQHDHPRPQTNRRTSTTTIMSNQDEENSTNFSSLMRAEDKSENVPCHFVQPIDPNNDTEMSPVLISEVDAANGSGQSNNCDEIVGDDDPEYKRRKMEIANADAALIGKVNHEPRVVVQTISEVDILDDGYRWRKYGQKVVKGNPNPRSYYKCTNAGCPVRKHVERASHDPKAVITTYEGKHNHDVPAARTTGHESSVSTVTNDESSAGAHSRTAALPMPGMIRNCSTRTFSHPFNQIESSRISLDLGVGIIPYANNITNEKHQSLEIEQVNYHAQSIDCNRWVVQATPSSASTLNGNSQPRIYESGDGGDGFTIKTTSINPSSMYYATAGNLVMGP